MGTYWLGSLISENPGTSRRNSMHVNLTEEEIQAIEIALDIANDVRQMAKALGVTRGRALEIMHSIDHKLDGCRSEMDRRGPKRGT
jgi:hypothetical protein